MNKVLALLLLWCGGVWADSLDIRIEPKEPLVNENFKVVFEINTEEGTDPVVNFDPLNLDVISRSETGVRTRTTYINGKLTTERSLTVVYEVAAKRPGSAFLRKINVELNGKKLRHKTVRINILKTPKKARDILVRAEVDKEEAFVGESVLVRYYLYNRAPVVSTNIKKFPKLESFLKRYHQEKTAAERVNLDGNIYTRRVIYTAQLFPAKPGDYKIDPITLGVRYSKRGSSPFDAFGFGSRYGGTRKVAISSSPVELKVKALPVENVPPSFTGLVGPHDFKLELSKNRFVVNEPIELKLTVSGEGALELYEAPKIFTEPEIESFETTADLEVRKDFSANKTFLYTYLGRDDLVLEKNRIPFSYFDPKTLEFKTEYIDLGKIVIGGGSYQGATGSYQKPGQAPANEAPAPTGRPAPARRLFEPLYKLAGTYSYSASYIAFGLGAVLLFALVWMGRDKISFKRERKPKAFVEAARRGVDYPGLRSLVSLLGEGEDMRAIVKNSPLSSETKDCLLRLADTCEKEYSKGGKRRKLRIPKKRLRELANLVKKP